MEVKKSSRSICVIIKLTTGCDLSCNYCGIAGPKADNHLIETMTLDKIVNLYSILSKSYDITNIDFLWHGGEPLLTSLKSLKDIIESQNIFHNKIITNSIQTNGTLITSEVAKFIKKYKIRMGVSLDGPKELQNAQRPMKRRNSDSFSLTMSGIEILKKHNIPFGTLAVVTKQTLKFGAQNLFDFFIKNGITTFDFLPQEPILFKNKLLTEYLYSDKEYTKFLTDLFDIWYTYDDPNISILYYEGIIKTLLNKNSEICQIGKDICANTVFTFYPDNTLMICDKFTRSNTDNSNMKIDINSVKSIDEVFLSQDYNKTLSYQTKSNDHCSNCDWFSYCRGGCVYDRYMYEKLNLPFENNQCPLYVLYNHIANTIMEKIVS